jgi:hypothetical protein
MDSMDHQLLIKFAKYLESCKDHKYDNSITLALNIYPSRSLEYNPGLSVRFCWYPSVIIYGVLNWIRFIIISDEIVVTYADNDEMKQSLLLLMLIHIYQ